MGWIRRLGLLGAVLGLPLLVPGVISADGTQTGWISGTVSTAEGVKVQGVSVELEGPQGTRRAVTDAAGRFRFPALRPGTYALRAELLELSAERTGKSVFAGRSTEADLVLRAADDAEPAVEDWIQVVGREAPLVDRFDTRVGANLAFELLDDLPVERFYQSFALLLPGVAGGRDGNPNTSGALRSTNLFLVDGVDTTDPTTGLFGLNLSYEAVQEVQVTTAAPGVEYGRVSGAVINVITRSGERRAHGLGRFVLGGDDWAESYREGADLDHLALERTTADSGRAEVDSVLSLSGGGPLVADRLGLFAAYQDTAAGALRPTLLGEPWNADSDIEAGALKLTWQPASQHTLVFQYAYDDARFTAFEPFSRGPSELQLPDVPGSGQLGSSFFQPVPGEPFALERRGQEGSFGNVRWDAALGQNLSLSLNLADQDRRLERGPADRRGLTADAPHVGAFLNPALSPEDQDEDELFLYLFNGVTEEGTEERPRRQGNLSVDLFRPWAGAEHELRLGFDYQETESKVAVEVPGQDGVDPLTGLPVSGQLYIDFDVRAPCLLLLLCAPFDPGDGSFRPVGLLNFYRRPPRSTEEESTAIYGSDTVALDRWVFYVGLRWDGVEGRDEAGRTLVDDRDLAPRLGVTYTPGSDGRTVLSASWGRFHEGFLHQYLDAYGRFEPLSGFTEYELVDSAPGVDCQNLGEVDLSSPCWRASGMEPPFALLPADPAAVEQSAVDEWTLGLETRLGARSSLSVHWVDRRWRDLWNGVERFLPAEDRVIAEVRNLPEAERDYRALQVLFRKRPTRHWQLLASYTWSEAEGNFFTDDGLGTFDDFGDLVDTNRVNRFGPAPYDRPHQAGLFGTWQVPLEKSFLTLGSTLTYRDGVPFQLERLEEAGIRFVTPRGSRRLSAAWQWDLAVDLEVDLTSRLTLEIRAEARNLTDEQEVIAVETLENTGLAGLPTGLDDLQTPRTFRLTLGLRL